MSTHFDAYCTTCEVWGPEIRRSPSGTKLLVRVPAGFLGGDNAAAAWADFLIKHEWCEIVLRREGNRPAGGKP